MINIREGNPNDVKTIAQFQVEMAMETEGLNLDLHTVILGVENCMKDSSKGKYFVAELDNKGEQ